jgi:hypothetical protein
MIPGEEAPTDPGEVVKKAQARADEKVRRNRTFLPFLAAMPLVGILVVTAVVWMLWPAPVIVPLELDELDMGTVQVVYLEAPATPAAAEAPTVAPRPRAPRPQVASSSQPAPAPNRVEAGRAPQPDGAAASPAPENSTVFGPVSLNVARRSGTLTDPDQIREMVLQRMSAQSGKLKACYEQRLKVREDLAGKWRIAYVVDTSGAVRSPTVTGLTAHDAEFESCVVDQLERWTFDRISRDQPIERTLWFRPG